MLVIIGLPHGGLMVQRYCWLGHATTLRVVGRVLPGLRIWSMLPATATRVGEFGADSSELRENGEAENQQQ
jgi:hypothetical protein